MATGKKNVKSGPRTKVTQKKTIRLDAVSRKGSKKKTATLSPAERQRKRREKDIEDRKRIKGKKKNLLSAKPKVKRSTQIFGGKVDTLQYATDLRDGLTQVKFDEPRKWKQLIAKVPELELALEEGVLTPDKKGDTAISPTRLIQGVEMHEVLEQEYRNFVSAINPIAGRRYANNRGLRALVHNIAGQPVAAQTQDVRNRTKQFFRAFLVDALREVETP